MIDNGRSKTWVGFAKMITQIGLTRYFTVSAPNKSLANIATFRQGFLIASSYYLPNLLGLSHRIPPTYSASIHPQRVSTLPRNAQAISVYQENDDSAQFLQMIPVSEEVASQFSSPSIPYDPIKYITGRMQAIVEAQEVGNPLPSEGNFVAVTSLLKGVFKHAGNPQYVGEDGKPYYEPKWGSVTDVFQIMNPYEKKGQFTGISVAIRSFSNGQMCTRFCMKKSEEQKNYECMKHRLSSFPLLAKSYQYLNDMDAFTIFQDKVVLELNEELQKHLDEWQVDRIEVEGTNEWLQKRSQNIEDASWATRILVFHKRVK